MTGLTAVGMVVQVTSGSAAKIDKAVALGAEGGVSYKDGKPVPRLMSLKSRC